MNLLSELKETRKEEISKHIDKEQLQSMKGTRKGNLLINPEFSNFTVHFKFYTPTNALLYTIKC